LPFSELITTASVSTLISNARGWSENSLRVSSRILAGIAMDPSPSAFSSFILVIKVDSRSDAVISRSLPARLNKKLSRIGNVFFVLITLLIACRCVRSSVLDTTNFIYRYV
jgi:ABC-type Fe3+-siderophore transport system permease subunit